MLVERMKPNFEFKNSEGSLIQLVREGWKQINVLYSKKDSKRGGHYHKICNEAFYIVSGKIKLFLEKGDEKEEENFKEGEMFMITPYINILEKTEKKILAADCNIEGKENTERVEWIKCDVTKQEDIEKINKKCNEYNGVKVLYLAAYHAPDLVKKNPKKAWDINVTSLSSFINSIENVDCLFYSSTEMVYGAGEADKKFSESDSLNPVNIYGENKIVAEALIKGYGYNVLRFPFLIGPSLDKNKKHFYDKIVDEITNGNSVEMFSDALKTALDFNTLTKIILELMENYTSALPKCINISGDDILSKYDIGLMIARKYNCNEELIIPISMENNNQIFTEKRANCTLLDNSLLKKILNLSEIKIEI